MKTLKPLFLAACALASFLPARAELSAPAWLETYYLHPQPAELPRTLQRLSASGYFDQPGNVAIAIGFIGTIFAAHPREVDAWLLELNGLPLRHHRLIAAALWQADHPLGPELLLALGQHSPLRFELERIARTPSQPIGDVPVQSASSLRLHWGAFLASGDTRHVRALVEALDPQDPALASTVRGFLRQTVALHPRFAELCRDEIKRQPADVQQGLQAILAEVHPTA